ncbi:alternative ribosome rescue aminoacyl-tRNA hydrolase ArfB [Pseudaeromonas sharmana]|uniref:Alternative ribosome rescue aminoacyl-tRNA hydrolase ArfB n=1 Tax=Pseudaeromonas sharmana TaxID=328412 RepID=A0ABV8CIS0_9GAMM
MADNLTTATPWLQISSRLAIPLTEIEMTAMRAQGAGGQNVNKVSSAIHLRFAVASSSLPEGCKQRLLASGDQRLTRDGVLVIKAQQYRTQEQNRQDALARLQAILLQASQVPVTRIATRPTLASKRRRLVDKQRRADIKTGRKAPRHDG